MKKIYTLAAFVFIAATSFAQRSFDLSVTLSTPVDQSTVAPSATQAISFTVKSSGDDLEVGDTLVAYFYNFTTDVVYALDGTPNFSNYFLLNAQFATALNSGTAIPSTSLNNGNVLTFNTTATGFSLGDEIGIILEIAPVTPGTDSNPGNNFGSFFLGNTASVNNLNKVEFNAYPNPAINVLTVTSLEDVVSLKIMNMEGKVISTSTGNNIDVSYLNGGVYFYEATTVSGASAINKFIKL